MKTKVSTYTNEQGQLVTLYPYKPPAKANRTWKAIRGSISNMGAKAVALNKMGHNVRSHG